MIQIAQLSDPAGGHYNEDFIAVFRHGDTVLDLLVLDGATSVADRHYIDQETGDAAWFVTRFCAILAELAAPTVTQEDSVMLALARLRLEFQAMPGAAGMPRYAYPIAAMTWVRLVVGQQAVGLEMYALGDCKLFLLDSDQQVHDLDPYHNPQEGILKAAIEQLQREGIRDGQARRERLLPMLRERREFQNFNAAPESLCLFPQGPFKARTRSLRFDRQATLLGMTDGFYRLADTYHLHTPEELVRRCAAQGLAPLLRQLRDFEAHNLASGAASVKQSDDASAAMCSFL